MVTTTFDQGWGDADRGQANQGHADVASTPSRRLWTSGQINATTTTWSQITTESGSNSQGAPSRGRQGRQGLEQACTLHALRRHRGCVGQTSPGRFAVQDPFETKNFKESDNNNDRTPSKPVRKNGSILRVRTQQEEARLQQYHVVWLVEQKKQRT